MQDAAAEGVGPVSAQLAPEAFNVSLGVHVQTALGGRSLGAQTGLKVGGVTSAEMVKVVEAVPGFPARSLPLTVNVYAPFARPVKVLDVPEQAAAGIDACPESAQDWLNTGSLGFQLQVALEPDGVQLSGVNDGGVISETNDVTPEPAFPSASAPVTVNVYEPSTAPE